MLKKIVYLLTKIMTVISCCVFAVIVVLVIVNIVGRSAFHAPVRGIVEIVQYGAMLCAGIVMCRSGLEERHISVVLLIEKFPFRLRSAFISLGKLLGTVVFIALSYLNASNIHVAIAAGKLTDTFRLPFQYIYLIMSICFAIGALVFLYQFCLSVMNIVKGGQAAQGAEDYEEALLESVESSLPE